MGLASYGFDARIDFLNHVAGLRELFRIRGDALLKDDASRSVLKAFRNRAIISAICQHQNLPFNRADHPWFFVELGDTHFDKLQNITVSMPAILQPYMALLARLEDGARDEHEELINKAHTVLAELRSWQREVKRSDVPLSLRVHQWYRLCEIICLRILDHGLTILSRTDRDDEVRGQHDVERELVVSTIHDCFKGLAIHVSKTPDRDGRKHEDAQLAALEALTPSDYLYVSHDAGLIGQHTYKIADFKHYFSRPRQLLTMGPWQTDLPHALKR